MPRAKHLEVYVDPPVFKIELDPEGRETTRDAFESLDLYVDDWLRETSGRQLALFADFGTGKTWFCLHYALRQLSRFLAAPLQERVPFFVPLREFCDLPAGPLMTSALVSLYKLPFVLNAAEVFKRLATQGRLLLILDAFDESTRNEDRGGSQRAFQLLRELATPGNKVLVTTRPGFFKSAKRLVEPTLPKGEEVGALRFEVLEIAPFTPKQLETAVQNRFSGQALRAATAVLKSGQLSPIGSKPLLLSILQSTVVGTHSASVSDVFMYATAAGEALLDHSNASKGVVSIDDTLLSFTEIAWAMFEKGVPRIHCSQLPERTSSYFRFCDSSFAEGDSTVLHRDATGHYEFAHRSFAEFFVALRIALEIGPILDTVRLALRVSNKKPDRTYSYVHAASDGVFGRFAFTDQKMHAVLGFLLELMDPGALATLKQILRERSTKPFLPSNAATLLVRSGVSLAGRNLSGVPLMHADFEGADLRRAKFLGSDLRGADLSNAYLANADLRNTDLRDIRFEHVSGVKAVRFRRGTGQLVSASSDGTIEVWTLNSGRLLRRIRAFPASMLGNFCLVQRDANVLSVGQNGLIRLWNLDSGALLAESSIRGRLVSVDASTDDALAVVMDWFGARIRLLELPSLEMRGDLQLQPGTGSGYDVRFSPDGQYVVAGFSGGEAVVWSMKTSKQVAVLRGHVSKTESLCFTGDGRYLVTGSYDKTLGIWAVDSWKLVAVLKEPSMVAELAGSRHGATILAALHNGAVSVWDIEKRRRVASLRGHAGSVYGVAISEDGTCIASCGQDGTIRVFDPIARSSTAVLEQAIRCPGLRLKGVRGLTPKLRKILVARGAVPD